MDLLTYTVTTALMAVAPGPVMATLTLRSLGGDSRGALAFASGILLAEAVLLALAMAGVAAWIEVYPGAVAVARWVGAAYLLILALEMWHRPPLTRAPLALPAADLSAGFLVAATNPYNPAFYLSVMPALGWRIEAFPMQVALATLLPSVVIYGGMILLGQLGRAQATGLDRPLFRRPLAAALAAMAGWIALSWVVPQFEIRCP